MRSTAPHPLIASSLFFILATSSALTQATNYTSVDIVAGVKMQIGFNSVFGKNCEPVRLPPIQVVTAPKHGQLQIRDGVVTGKENSQCALQKTPAQIIFYESSVSYSGPDVIVFEAANQSGVVTRYQINVTVKEAPKTGKPNSPGQNL